MATFKIDLNHGSLICSTFWISIVLLDPRKRILRRNFWSSNGFQIFQTRREVREAKSEVGVARWRKIWENYYSGKFTNFENFYVLPLSSPCNANFRVPPKHFSSGWKDLEAIIGPKVPYQYWLPGFEWASLAVEWNGQEMDTLARFWKSTFGVATFCILARMRRALRTITRFPVYSC